MTFKVVHELVENHHWFCLPPCLPRAYSFAKLLTTSKHKVPLSPWSPSFCQLDFPSSSCQALQPSSRSFAQIQSRINSILCCVLIEILFVHFKYHLIKFSCIIFLLFLPQSRKCVFSKMIPHFLYILSTLNYFILWKYIHGENSKGTNEFRINGSISKMLSTNPCSLGPEASSVTRFLHILSDLFCACKRTYLFLYFQHLGSIVYLLCLHFVF